MFKRVGKFSYNEACTSYAFHLRSWDYKVRCLFISGYYNTGFSTP